MLSPQESISADDLEKLTGLSDRRHRQLAKIGFFPIPKNGMYVLTDTIRGMFKYYREEFQRNSKALMDDKQMKLKREIELLDLKISEERRTVISLDAVESVWSQVCIALRQVILSADVPHKTKEELARHLREIPIDEYIQRSSHEDGEALSEVDPVAAED